MTLIGIDYGSKRVGVAISDDSERFAFPLSVLEVKGRKPEEIALEISSICKDKGVTKVVIGESKNLKGEMNIIMKDIQVCIDKLIESGLDVATEPEWFSTAQAERYQGKKDDIDSSAAAVILQAHLDKMHYKKDDTLDKREINI